MDATSIATALAGLVVGAIIGRLSAGRRATRVVSGEALHYFPPDAAIIALVREGKMIEAIKRHRELHGTDLMEAKDAIDALAVRLRESTPDAAGGGG